MPGDRDRVANPAFEKGLKLEGRPELLTASWDLVAVKGSLKGIHKGIGF